jgi:histidine triad (HIT) family protein
MKNCIFCKIVKGEIPCTEIYEDEDFLAFMEINPVSIGHTLVIPKKHYETVYSLPENISSKYLPTINKIANAMKKALSTKKIVLSVWGEDVAHAHIHLIPRYENDNLHFFKQNNVDMAELTIQAEKIINLLD